MEEEVCEALAFWGAPFASVARVEHMSLEEAILQGIEAAKENGMIFRVLPLVLAKHRLDLDWNVLLGGARRSGLKAELGVLIDLTADLLADEELASHAERLMDRRRRRLWYFPEVRSRYERELAELNTPEVVRRWGVRMNVGRESFVSLFEKHLGRLGRKELEAMN